MTPFVAGMFDVMMVASLTLILPEKEKFGPLYVFLVTAMFSLTSILLNGDGFTLGQRFLHLVETHARRVDGAGDDVTVDQRLGRRFLGHQFVDLFGGH
jgi:hypothetical protein